MVKVPPETSILYNVLSDWVDDGVNTLRPRQNGGHFPDDIFKCIFLNENEWISITISLKFVLKGPINNIPVLVQIIAWRRLGDKQLSGPMMVRLPTHICVTRLRWVNTLALAHTTLQLRLAGQLPVPIIKPVLWLTKRAWEEHSAYKEPFHSGSLEIKFDSWTRTVWLTW